jgi:hypothetical protein
MRPRLIFRLGDSFTLSLCHCISQSGDAWHRYPAPFTLHEDTRAWKGCFPSLLQSSVSRNIFPCICISRYNGNCDHRVDTNIYINCLYMLDCSKTAKTGEPGLLRSTRRCLYGSPDWSALDRVVLTRQEFSGALRGH